MKSDIFQYDMTVPESAIDEVNHVNNVVYLQWVQDVAIGHWKDKVALELRQKYFWVAMNHYIEYKAPAFLNDLITLQTWVADYRGARMERHTKILHTETQKILITAKTTWCFMSTASSRPTRIPEEISSLYF